MADTRPPLANFVGNAPTAAKPALSTFTQPPVAVPTASVEPVNTDPLNPLTSNTKPQTGVLDTLKSAFNFFTGSEQNVGKEIAAGLPASITGEKQLNQANQSNAASDVAYIKTIQQRKAAGQAVTPTQQQLYDTILAHHSSVGTQTDLLPNAADSNAQALGNVAGVGADALTAGTYSKVGLAGDKALTTGLTKAAPTIASAAATGADTAITAVKGALTKTPEQIAAQQAAKIADVVAPKLTARETADAIASRGGTKTGILGTIKANTDPAVQRIADTVSKYVPDFSPKKSLVENINATRTATDNIAQQLKSDVIKSGQDRIYSFKELQSTLNKLPKPTLLVGDLEKVYGRVTDKAMEIARSNGGKVSDLFQARKEFDDFVRQQFPNLYSSDALTPMRSAIKNVRNAMTDFTAEHLPEDVGLHDGLKVQSHLLTAIENMSAKAASGAKKEIGTNAIERATSAVKNHPVLGGFGAAAAYETAKRLPGVGGILP